MRDRERIQRQQHNTEANSSFETQPQLNKALQRGGQPLDAATRNFLEPKFGHSFENVQIHADGEADMLSQDFGARAFTTGPNIFFRAGEFDPTSNDGLHLLAHELTHTVQQRLTSNRLDRAMSSKSDGAEGEARAAADAVMGGQAVSVAPSATAAISRFGFGDLMDETESTLDDLPSLKDIGIGQPFGAEPGSSGLETLSRNLPSLEDMGIGQPLKSQNFESMAQFLPSSEQVSSLLSDGLWKAGSMLPGGIGEAVKGTQAVKNLVEGEGDVSDYANAIASPFKGAAKLAEENFPKGAAKFGAGLGAVTDGFSAFSNFAKGEYADGTYDVGKTLMGAGEALGGASLLGEGGLAGIASTAWGGGGLALGEGALLTTGASSALTGGAAGLGSAAGLGTAATAGGAVLASGAAGWMAGRALDKGVDWLGDKISGKPDADHSISGALGDGMTAVDQGATSLLRNIGVLDESKPEYTQTLGWKLANMFD
jgi:Domain of unknown function (DUF4157)